MRTAVIAALLGSTALTFGAMAQTQSSPQQGEAQATAAVPECDRLMAFLDEARPIAGITADQARKWKQSSNVDECRKALDRVTQAGNPMPQEQQNATAPSTSAPASSAAVTAPAATPAQSEAASPNSATAARVVVQQAQPNVTVRQGQPEIIVRMPPPVITVQQAQPEIIVRMPEPDVNVAMARPDVQVTLPQPQVQVQPPAPQTEANVQVERQQPNVRVERTGEPQIVYQPAEGQPQIRFESMGVHTAGAATATGPGERPLGTAAPTQQAAQAQLNSSSTGYGTTTGNAGAPGDATRNPPPAVAPLHTTVEPSATGALPDSTRPMEVSKIEDMTLYNNRNEKLGDVEHVVSAPDGKSYVVVASGGFLGVGEKRVLIPLEQVAFRDDRLLADHLTDEQIKALPSYEKSSRFRELEGRQTASVRVAR